METWRGRSSRRNMTGFANQHDGAFQSISQSGQPFARGWNAT